MQSTTLRPGYLVALNTSVAGKNCQYRKEELEGAHITDDGVQRARWETTRTIEDPVEFEAGQTARKKARALISKVCMPTSFGLLCTEARYGELERAIAEARKVVDEFNELADITRVSVYVITGRIAPTDAEAVRAINSELRNLMGAMEQGISNVDVIAIRAAAAKAKQLGAMLTPDAASRVQDAVEAARRAASRYVQAGEAAALEIDTVALRSLATARTAFLDIESDTSTEVAEVAAEARGVDFETIEPIETITPTAATVPQFEV